MSRPRGGWGLPESRGGAKGGAYHGHLLLEVLQVPALLGSLALFRRTLVIFLVLRGGDTIAVRTTRLWARGGCRGTGPSSPLSPPLCLSVCVSRWVSLWLWVSLKLVSLISVKWHHCLWLHVSGCWGSVPAGLHLGCLRFSLLLGPGLWVTPFCLYVSFSPSPGLSNLPSVCLLFLSVSLLVCLGLCLCLYLVLFCLPLFPSISASLWLYLFLISRPHPSMLSVCFSVSESLCMSL